MSRKAEGAPFRSLLTAHERFFCPAGSREADSFEIQIDKKGHKSLKWVGTHDIYQDIQSYKEECSIENIIARAAAGDLNALNKTQGFYADITNSPKDLAEAQREIMKLSNTFDALPAEIRAKFDNSKEMFINEFGTKEFAEKMGWSTGTTEKAPNQAFSPEVDAAKEVLTPEV